MVELSAPIPERISADLEELAGLREDGPGWTRRVFTEEDRAGRELVGSMMGAAGLETTIDAAGNVIGVLPGTSGAREALVTGSHTDTVAGGGRFDGIVGVLGAIEAVRVLRESSVRLHHDLRVVAFLGEEPNRFGLGCVGSRALAGRLSPAHLDLRDEDGLSMGAALAAVGGDPHGALDLAWAPADLKGYFELHVEQGPHLERLGTPLGVVTAIVGIQRLVATFRGRPDHAGTMPMGDRRDAGCAAAAGMLAIEQLAVDGNVATVGRLELSPGASNVVPGRARLWAEGRSVDGAWLERFTSEVDAALVAAGARRRVEVDLEWLSLEAPTPMAAAASAAVTDAAASLGHPIAPLASYAGHDAAQLAALTPAAMIFIPSQAGRSHCPEEWTDLGDIATGVHTLAQTLVVADRR